MNDTRAFKTSKALYNLTKTLKTTTFYRQLSHNIS